MNKLGLTGVLDAFVTGFSSVDACLNEAADPLHHHNNVCNWLSFIHACRTTFQFVFLSFCGFYLKVVWQEGGKWETGKTSGKCRQAGNRTWDHRHADRGLHLWVSLVPGFVVASQTLVSFCSWGQRSERTGRKEQHAVRTEEEKFKHLPAGLMSSVT